MIDIDTCRACSYSTPDHFCSHPETLDGHGKPGLYRHVLFVVMRNGNGHAGCCGRLFSAREPVNNRCS